MNGLPETMKVARLQVIGRSTAKPAMVPFCTSATVLGPHKAGGGNTRDGHPSDPRREPGRELAARAIGEPESSPAQHASLCKRRGGRTTPSNHGAVNGMQAYLQALRLAVAEAFCASAGTFQSLPIPTLAVRV